MAKSFRGKFLVRVASSQETMQKRVVLCGVFVPNFDIDELNENDEMWVAELSVVSGGIRFTGKETGGPSPEDFLEGAFMSPRDWKNREQLDLFLPEI